MGKDSVLCHERLAIVGVGESGRFWGAQGGQEGPGGADSVVL